MNSENFEWLLNLIEITKENSEWGNLQLKLPKKQEIKENNGRYLEK